MNDVDCPAGARCVSDSSGGTGCRDAFMMQCEYNTDCGDVLICAPDGVCREQCHTDRDCRDGTVCDQTMSPTVCGPPRDAGMPSDAATDDSGMDASTPPSDTGVDGGTDAGTDTGVDASASRDTGVDAAMDAAMAMTGPAPVPLAVAGSDHVCATRTSDGQLRCWGNNTYGQIGDTTVMNRLVATAVTPALANVTVLAAGVSHSCAYSTSAGFFCWGDGTSGQLGDGFMVARSSPRTVSGGLAPTWLAAGHAHTCAVIAGAVRCWGANASGQLGDGTTSQRLTATPTLALAASAIEVSAGGDTTCARLSDGRVQCWGASASGQLGVDLSPATYSATPLLVAGVTNAVEIVNGINHTCARDAGGVVSCWGSQSSGRLGDGVATATARLTPAPTNAMPPAVELAAAGAHTCARTIAGDVYCWGDNFGGQCGRDGFVSPVLSSPSLVSGVSGALELTTGENHTCARVAAGFVCWGDNASGELGDNTTTPHFAPGAVTWI